MKRRFGILSRGGDCPGINAVIRAATKRIMREGCEMMSEFSRRVWRPCGKSLPCAGRGRDLRPAPPRGHHAGQQQPVQPHALPRHHRRQDRHERLHGRGDAAIQELGIEGIIAIGGDGTLGRHQRHGCPRLTKAVTVPKTIDNDLPHTDQTFGFDTAVRPATEALDKLHSTAESHHR